MIYLYTVLSSDTPKIWDIFFVENGFFFFETAGVRRIMCFVELGAFWVLGDELIGR